MTKELELKADPEANLHLDSQRATPKKILKWKIPRHDGIYGF